MTDKPYVYEIKLKRGLPEYNVAVEPYAPQIDGFIALRCTVAQGNVEAIRYISLDNVDELTISVEMLKRWNINSIVPKGRIKVKIDDSL